jgi:hypothetical protein
MSTGDEPSSPANLPTHRPISDILSRGTDAHPPLPVDESAAALELRLQKETDGRQEDKFYAIAIGTVLLNTAVFQHLPWIGIVCIFLLELVVLLGLAKRLGSEHVTVLLDFLFHKLCERIGLGKD